MDSCAPSRRYDGIGLMSISGPDDTYNDNQIQPSNATDITSSHTNTHKEEEAHVDVASPSDPSLFSGSPSDTKPSGWERCRVEVRDMIFDELEDEYPNYFDWKGFMPPLIVALRPLSLSYQQALQRFVGESRSTLRMHTSTGFDIGDMNQMELDTFQSANLELSDIVHTLWWRPRKDDPEAVEYGFQKPKWFTDQFLRATNIRQVHLNLEYKNNVVTYSEICRWMTQFPFWIEGFKRLSEVIVEVPVSWDLDGLRNKRIMEALMARVLKKVGVQGKCVRVSQRRREPLEIWSWEAADGQFMDWSENLGTIWKHPPLGPNWMWWPDEEPWNFFAQSDYYGDQLGMRNGQFVILGDEDADEE